MESGTQGHGGGGGPLSTECSIASKILRGGTFIRGDENKKPEAVGKDQDDGQGGGQANVMAGGESRKLKSSSAHARFRCS